MLIQIQRWLMQPKVWKNMLIQIQRWLMQQKVWRFVCFASAVVGMFCYAHSFSFNNLLGEWTWWKILLYFAFSVIICVAILFAKAWQCSPTLRQRAHLAFLVLIITSVYSFFYDKVMNGKPDAYCLLSSASFAIMSLGLSRQTHFGFEVDLLYFFCGSLIIQLMTIKLWLVIIGGSFSYSLIILRSSLDASLGSAIQVNSSQANTGVDEDLEDPPLINPTYIYSRPINSIAMFEIEYGHWVEEQDRQNEELKNAFQTHASDVQLRLLVECSLNHYSNLFRMKGDAAKVDVLYIISGAWQPSTERLFLWIGGHRPSELINIVLSHLEPMAEQQILSIYSLRHQSQQAEDALSQGMEKLQQSLVHDIPADPLIVGNYGLEMAVALEKCEILEGFVNQADNLRQQTLQHMSRILTTRQAAQGLLAMGEFIRRLRTLSNLWTARSCDLPAYPTQH